MELPTYSSQTSAKNSFASRHAKNNQLLGGLSALRARVPQFRLLIACCFVSLFILWLLAAPSSQPELTSSEPRATTTGTLVVNDNIPAKSKHDDNADNSPVKINYKRPDPVAVDKSEDGKLAPAPEERDEKEPGGLIVPDPPAPNGQLTPPKEFGDVENTQRREAVKKMFLHAWDGYKKYAWGDDDLKPLSKSGHNWLGSGLAASLIDSMPTMWLMGYKDEFKVATNWIAENMSAKFEKNTGTSMFETVIRILGGLMSAYDLSGETVLLEKARDLADRIMVVFDSPSGVPKGFINLKHRSASQLSWTGGRTILAEAGSLQMEFCSLAERLGRPEYCQKTVKVFDTLAKSKKEIPGLYPLYINSDGSFSGNTISLGALGDSYYEYLLKMYLLTDKQVPRFKRLYEESVDSIAKHMIRMKDDNHKFTLLGQLQDGRLNQNMDHLSCFAGGMFALGSVHVHDGAPEKKQRDLDIAKGIAETCHHMYADFPVGIAPESVFVRPERLEAGSRYYILRPETVETYFILWRITKDQKYRDWGWEIFQAIEKNCRNEAGYSGLRDATSNNPIQDDQQQSFFLSETVKYLYLLFSDDNVLSLDDYIFNTESHPIRSFTERPYAKWKDLFQGFDDRQ